MNPYYVYPDGDQWFWATLAEANQGLSVSQTSILPSEHCREILGIPGQGNSPNPPAYFARHYWVSDGRFYHDPSFGKRAETLDVISRGVFECYMYQFAEHNGDFAVIKSPPQLTTKEVKE